MKKDKKQSLYGVGTKISDNIAKIAGSWTFIFVFVFLLIAWIAVNTIFAFKFDPYPYILLNLILSTIAALQAPLILMSQNRQAESDRQRAIEDHQLNVQINMKLNAILRAETKSLAELAEIDKKLDDLD
jgi:uncharacterized membrane protein